MVSMDKRLVWRLEPFSRRSDVTTRSDSASVCSIHLQRIDPGLHRPAEKAIICIEEYQKLSSAFCDSGVPRSCRPLIHLMTIVNLGVPFCHLTGVVRRSVVDHKNLNLTVTLAEHTLQRLGQEVSLVVTGDDDRDERFAPHR
jgi:hypothetical protein